MSQSKISIGDTQLEALKAVLESINTNGLIPANKIPNKVLTNPVTNCQLIDGDICVNYVNLSQAKPIEIKATMAMAVDEEYCGIYGICLERQWPFQRFSSPKLLHLEISDRLMQSVVFILNPPQKNPKITMVYCGKIPIKVASYEDEQQEGFSQSRGKSIVTGFEMPHSNNLTEIKTPHNFKKNEVKAVLVPEHLAALAAEIFCDLPIIPVISKKLKLNSLPKILEHYHNEKLAKPIEIEAPDYLNALTIYCEKNKLTEFSLHAVRLHTSCDFMVRSISKVLGSEQVLKSTHAKIAQKFDDDSAFIIVHKSYGQNKHNLFKRLRENNLLPMQYILKMEEGAEYTKVLNLKLTELKNGLIISNIYHELSESQLSLLIDPAIKISQTDNYYYYVLTYPPQFENYVNKVINKFSAMQDASIKIQAYYRSSQTQRFFQNYQQKYENLKVAQQELELAGEQLKNFGSL